MVLTAEENRMRKSPNSSEGVRPRIRGTRPSRVLFVPVEEANRRFENLVDAENTHVQSEFILDVDDSDDIKPDLKPLGVSDAMCLEDTDAVVKTEIPEEPEVPKWMQRRAERKRRQLESFDHVLSTKGDSKSGSCGQPIILASNFVKVQQKGQWRLYHYHASFEPELQITKEKKELMKNFSGLGEGKLGPFIFDGQSLWTSSQLTANRDITLDLQGLLKNIFVKVRLTLVAELQPGDVMYLQFYSIMVRKCLELLNLSPLGRHFFDQREAVAMPEHRLELWPGFVTSMRQLDAALLYNVEIIHKVIRTDTVLEMMTVMRHDLERSRGFSIDQAKEAIKKEVVGNIVLTTYNNKTYRVDDIIWNENALSTFMQGQGDTPISYVDYYKNRHDTTIRVPKQPLLISNPKKSDIRRGHRTPSKLLPELCRMTGLNDNLRKNFKLMRDLGKVMFQAPTEKVTAIEKFLQRLKFNSKVQQEMHSWGLNVTTKLVEFEGRVIPREGILCSNGSSFLADDNGDFTRALRGVEMKSSVALRRWILIVPQRDQQYIDNLLSTLRKVGQPLGLIIQKPTEVIRLRSITPESYTDEIKRVVANYTNIIQLVFIVLANNNLETYSAVKKRCSIDYGLPSQCFQSKNLKSNGLMSIATKVAIQMNAKLGGEPWSVHIPFQLKGLMVVGFDVHKSGSGSKRISVGAMVCNTHDSHGRYFSCVSFFHGLQDLCTNMPQDIAKCISAWRKVNDGALPTRIMFYRDGVGEGQLQYVFSTELEAVKRMIQGIYEGVNLKEPKFTFIVCTKKTNTRFFVPGLRGYENPPPGTVADNCVTIPERYDFFLISHAARQGTVSPTTYNVLYDESELEPDKIQRLTFKLCHLYYNWSGGISIPAVVQYATKLAFLTGLSLQSEVNNNLSHKLHFL